MTRARICICVATYNQEHYIEQCLRSILDQVVDADVRVLVSDDASTDATGDVILSLAAEYGGRLQHVRRDRNLGAFANLLDLLSRADGDFIGRVDGDDYWLPGKLARQLAYMHSNPGCSAVYTNALTVDDVGRAIGLFNDLGDATLELAALLRRGNVLNNSSLLYRAPHGTGWREGNQVDYQIHLWLARHGWLGHIGEPLVAYRVNVPGSLVTSSHERIRELYWQAIQSVPRDLVSDDDYAHGITDFLRRVLFRCVRLRDPALFRKWAVRVHAASPYGILRTNALVAASVARIGVKMLAAPFGTSARHNVLYRR